MATEHGKLVGDNASCDGTEVVWLGGAVFPHINRSRICCFCGVKINKCVKVDWTTRDSSQDDPHGRAAIGQCSSTTFICQGSDPTRHKWHQTPGVPDWTKRTEATVWCTTTFKLN